MGNTFTSGGSGLTVGGNCPNKGTTLGEGQPDVNTGPENLKMWGEGGTSMNKKTKF